MSLFKSFKYAFEGILYCIKNERNMRIHTVVTLYVLIFARFFAFTKAEYAVLLLTIGGVTAAEATNTAIEKLADRITQKHDPLIKIAKDAAAGAVLIRAIFSVGIGLFLFGNIEKLSAMYNFYISHPINLAGIIALTVISIIFIINPFRKKGTKATEEKK